MTKPFWRAAALPLSTIVIFTGLASCNWLRPNEEYLQQKGKTVYRSADHTSPQPDRDVNVPPPQTKIPGE